MKLTTGLYLAALAGLAGCATSPTTPDARLAATEIAGGAFAVGGNVRQATLLDFSKPSTTVQGGSFDKAVGRQSPGSVGAMAGEIRIDATAAYAAASAGPWADWQLLGVHLRVSDPCAVTVIREVRGTTVDRADVRLAPGKWTPIYLDAVNAAEPGILRVIIPAGVVGWVDDLVVASNQTRTDRTAGDARTAVSYAGRQIVIHTASRRIALPSAKYFQNGYEVADHAALRIRLARGTTATTAAAFGPPQAAAILADGRTLTGTESPEADLAVENGRLERYSPGDPDHRGYDRQLGAWIIAGEGRRVVVTLTPTAAPLDRPLLEIRGMSPGTPSAICEGQVLRRVERLENGNVLIELPANVERATSVEVRVK